METSNLPPAVAEYLTDNRSELFGFTETLVGYNTRNPPGRTVDGLKLTSLILGTILAVGLAAVLLSAYTLTFEILGAPLVPVIEALGIPSAETVAPATIVGITEMYVPVLLVEESAPMARFFVAVLAVSQLIFFSSVGPMTMDMFSDVPVRFRDLVTLFVMRTVILVPLVAGMTHLVSLLGLL